MNHQDENISTCNELAQQENVVTGSGEISAEIARLARQCAAEGCVLLKNDGALPVGKNAQVAVFGRCQLDWFYVGYGSGGDVHPPYRADLMTGLRAAGVHCDEALASLYSGWCRNPDHSIAHGGWGNWPMSYPEMPLDKNTVDAAAERCDTALVVIGRAAGEDRENTLTPGGYYLTELEKEMLALVAWAFRKTVVIVNAGNIIDMSWTEEYGDRISGILLAWQGGMESGNAVADVLTGKVNPSGRLTDTIARRHEDYPGSGNFGGEINNYAEDIFVGYRYFDTFAGEKILYPFGHGLSYTSFEKKPLSFEKNGGVYRAVISVSNTGGVPGRETVMLWCYAPQGKLGKPKRVLAAFGKTGLLAPGQEENLTLKFDPRSIASYDDTGKTGYPNAFVLEEGEYRFAVDGMDAGMIRLPETECLLQCREICGVKDPFDRWTACEENGEIIPGTERVQAGGTDLRQRILEGLPEEIPYTGDRGYLLPDVARGKVSLDTFIAQLTDPELEGLTRGEGTMNSSLGTEGNTGAFGGILPSLRQKGIPPVITSDGPSGLRVSRVCALLPCGTAQACTWDEALVTELYRCLGEEMHLHQVEVLLAPGMNIHRDPLCGRNFEYFSEDPLVTGKMAAAVVRGVQSTGLSCCPKHFACNNQEVMRNRTDSRVSQRALREIYLRGFEICVKEAEPNTLMTSYNKINGVWSHYNYDLATTVLRQEWGFDGVVVTDWWMQRSPSPEFPRIRDNAYRVRAQVDVLMPGNMIGVREWRYVCDESLLETIDTPDGITRGELQRTAKNVLRFILKTKKI